MNRFQLPEDITRRLSEHRFGVLATYGGAYPYPSLISMVFSHDFRYLVFPTLRETHKYANLLHESRVSILLDNRSHATNSEDLYTVTLLGTATEGAPEMFPEFNMLLQKNHPNLANFISQQQTALIQVVPEKIILVEEFQRIREFDLKVYS